MNKNKEVLTLELNSDNEIERIYEVIDIRYAPLRVYNAYYGKAISCLKELNGWFHNRGIPDYRKNLDILLGNLKVGSPRELLNKAYGLSLADQYWIRKDDDKIKWEDINFFTNTFLYDDYLQATFSSALNKSVSLVSPNNTTDGMISKAWVIDNKVRKLIKGSYSNLGIEPINEWLATRICNKLNIDACLYEVDKIDGKLVSICDNFLSEDEEIITADDIFWLKAKSNSVSDYMHYVNILESMGINDVKDKLSDMYVVDYLMLNVDRHMKNYGIIRNVNTLKWERVTPIFDTGQSLGAIVDDVEFNYYDAYYKLFTNTKVSFNRLIKYIDGSRYNISVLDDLPMELEEKLLCYNDILKMSNDDILKIVNGFRYRIDLLKVKLEEKK